MALYQATFSIAGVNIVDQVLFNLKSTTTDRPRLLEVGMFVETAQTNATQFSLKRMLAVGTGAITLAAIAQNDTVEPAASCALETAWATTRPTVTGGAFRRTLVPIAVGNGIIWDFTSRPLIVPVSAGVCGCILNASGATLGVIGGYVVWEE